MTDSAHTVLVIDDEMPTLTMFRLFLTAYGYRVLLAENGRDGLQMVQRHRPDIVFTDLKMPEMDGFEVLKEIKRISPRTEVVVITGHGDMDLVIQALNLDATDFLNKPIKRNALNAALRRATERLQAELPEKCMITFGVDKGIGRIGIAGTLRRENREALQQCRQEATRAGCRCIILHFLENAAVNGAGITELTNFLAALRQDKQSAAVIGLSENFRMIFEMVGMDRFAALCETEEQAEAVLGLPA